MTATAASVARYSLQHWRIINVVLKTLLNTGKMWYCWSY